MKKTKSKENQCEVIAFVTFDLGDKLNVSNQKLKLKVKNNNFIFLFVTIDHPWNCKSKH